MSKGGIRVQQRREAPDETTYLRRFELAPPRHFLFPALLLLLSEEPGYGYGLVKQLRAFRFGEVDRPSVYRALAQLEQDGLVESWSAAATAGQSRRVYGLTDAGQSALRAWMGVIKEERNCLDEVLRRYQSTGSVDAALAQVEGEWTADIGRAVSPLSPTTLADWRAPTDPTGLVAVPDGAAEVATGRHHFDIVPDRSVVLVEARSTVGPISFGAIDLRGDVDAEIVDGELQPGATAHVEIPVEHLRSGNSVYDAELQRRIDARAFPTVSIDLVAAEPLGLDGRFRLDAMATFHGVTRPITGTVVAAIGSDGRLVVTGEQVFDIRDHDVESPTVLMLRIYPDVKVRLQLEAVPAD